MRSYSLRSFPPARSLRSRMNRSLEVFRRPSEIHAQKPSARREGVRCARRHEDQHRDEGRLCVLQRKKHGCVQGVGFPEDVAAFYRLESTGAIPGRRTAVSHQHPRLVGGAHPFTLLDYSVVHNGKYPLMTPTAALSKCSVTNARFRPIPKCLPISWIISCVCRALRFPKRQT